MITEWIRRRPHTARWLIENENIKSMRWKVCARWDSVRRKCFLFGWRDPNLGQFIMKILVLTRVIYSLVINSYLKAMQTQSFLVEMCKLIPESVWNRSKSWPQATIKRTLPRYKIDLFYIFLNSDYSDVIRCPPFLSVPFRIHFLPFLFFSCGVPPFKLHDVLAVFLWTLDRTSRTLVWHKYHRQVIW